MKKQYTKPTAVGVSLQVEAPLLNSSYEVSAEKQTDVVMSNEKGWSSSNWQTTDDSED